MTLGLFLAPGESLESLKKNGQFGRFQKYYLETYHQNFSQIFLFTFAKETLMDPNISLITPPFKMPHLLYSLFLPFFHFKNLKKCDVFRGMHIRTFLCGWWLPLTKKKFLLTYGYREDKFLKIERRIGAIFFFKIIEYLALKFASGVVVTYREMQEYVKRFRKKNIFLIPNGVDTTKFKIKNEKLKIKGGKKTIKVLFVGRLEKQKNLPTLINAVSLLSNPNIDLIFIGEGSLKNQLMELALSKKVKLTVSDFILHDKLPEIYQQADIFVLPSLIEGHVKVLLEALSSGLACIAANTTGIKEIIHNNSNGLLFDGSKEDLARKISLLIGNHELAKTLGQQARQTALKYFDLKLLLQKEMEIIKKMTDE